MKFGAHESIEGGVFNAIFRGRKATCDTVQMFNKANNQWRAKKLSPEEIDKFFVARRLVTRPQTEHQCYGGQTMNRPPLRPCARADY